MSEWTLVTAPTQEPITLADAKDHARIVGDDENGLLLNYIKTAREEAESYMARGLYTQTWKLWLNEFADAIFLPMAAPLQSVTTVKYYDSTGTLTTLSSSVYDVDTASRPGRITLAAGQTWPAIQWSRMSGRVEITYVVGWSAVSAIPERIKQGIRFYVAYLHMDREGLENASVAREAAERCWSDRVYWKQPEWYC